MDNPEEEPVDENTTEDAGPAKDRRARVIDEDTDIVTFSDEQMITLSEYFKDTNAETAFMLGKYCGLRINECYGLKWCNVDFDNGIIKIDRQMQYQNGVIKLVSLKTRNARRDIIMSTPLKEYLLSVKRRRDEIMVELAEQREQNQTMLSDMGKEKISSLELVNSLDEGKIQTDNSMKYHTQKIKIQHGIIFKYHYLRHPYVKSTTKKIWRFFSTSKSQLRTAIPNWLYQLP